MDIYAYRVIHADGKSGYCYEMVYGKDVQHFQRPSVEGMAREVRGIAHGEADRGRNAFVHLAPRADIQWSGGEGSPWRCFPLERGEAGAFWEAFRTKDQDAQRFMEQASRHAPSA